MEKKVVPHLQLGLARPRENLVRSTCKVFDYENGGYARRLLPNPPPPPQWTWGPVIEVDDKEAITEEQDKVKDEEKQDQEGEPQAPYLDNALVESVGDRIILNYFHGKKEELMTRKYFKNPLYVKPAVASADDRLLDERIKKEMQEIDAGHNAEVLKKEEVPEAAAVIDNDIGLNGMDEEVFDYPGQDKQSHAEVHENLKNVKNDPSPKASQNSTRKTVNGRKRAVQAPSDLDNIIGQKLSKSRVAVSSRSYARPSKKQDTQPKIADAEVQNDPLR